MRIASQGLELGDVISYMTILKGVEKKLLVLQQGRV